MSSIEIVYIGRDRKLFNKKTKDKKNKLDETSNKFVDISTYKIVLL